MPERKDFQLKLPSDLHRKVKIAAAEAGVTMNDYIVAAITKAAA